MNEVIEDGYPYQQPHELLLFDWELDFDVIALSSRTTSATACTALGLKVVVQTAAFRLKPWTAILL